MDKEPTFMKWSRRAFKLVAIGMALAAVAGLVIVLWSLGLLPGPVVLALRQFGWPDPELSSAQPAMIFTVIAAAFSVFIWNADKIH